MLANQKSESRAVQAVIDALISNPAYDGNIAHRLALQHLSGDGNIMSDLVSRGLWAQFEKLCAALRIRPINLKLTVEEAAVIQHVVDDAQPSASKETEAHLTAFTAEDLRPSQWHQPDTGETTIPRSSRSRSPSPTEQGRGKARRDNNADGDGPFRPPWRRESDTTPQTRVTQMTRTHAWTATFPERESLKLAGFLLYVAQNMRPRSRNAPAAKPTIVYQRYLALRRVFKRREVDMPPTTAVRDTFKGLV
ncbi:MAG: hypothetical protein SGPRY_011447 [Prymnesium sp.]